MFATPTGGRAGTRREGLKVITTTLPKRSPVFPDAPTMAEAGMPQFALVSWAALFAPAKTPKEVIDRLKREFVAAMKKPEVVAAMDKQAFFLLALDAGETGPVRARAEETYARTCAPRASSRVRMRRAARRRPDGAAVRAGPGWAVLAFGRDAAVRAR